MSPLLTPASPQHPPAPLTRLWHEVEGSKTCCHTPLGPAPPHANSCPPALPLPSWAAIPESPARTARQSCSWPMVPGAVVGARRGAALVQGCRPQGLWAGGWEGSRFPPAPSLGCPGGAISRCHVAMPQDTRSPACTGLHLELCPGCMDLARSSGKDAFGPLAPARGSWACPWAQFTRDEPPSPTGLGSAGAAPHVLAPLRHPHSSSPSVPVSHLMCLVTARGHPSWTMARMPPALDITHPTSC